MYYLPHTDHITPGCENCETSGQQCSDCDAEDRRGLARCAPDWVRRRDLVAAMDTGARFCTIYIQAAKGSRQAARGVASRALKSAGARHVEYLGEKRAKELGLLGALYHAYMTDAQYETFNTNVVEFSKAAGFGDVPLDYYND